MNSSLLVLLGSFETLIAIIQSDRELFGKSFDAEAAVQTLKKIKSEFVHQLLASTRAQLHASETFRSTVDQLLAGLPQGSDLECLVRSLQLTVVNFLPQGPTPPWPSRSSSKDPFDLSLGNDLSQLITGLQRLAEQKGRLPAD